MSAGRHLHDWTVRSRVSFGEFCSDKVRVVSKNNDDEHNIWGSLAGGSFTVQTDTEVVHGEVKRGTMIICNLKQDQSEF